MKSLLGVVRLNKSARSAKVRGLSSSCIASNSRPGPPLQMEKTELPRMTLGISNDEFSSRRQTLMDKIYSQSSKVPHILIMPGVSKRYMIDKIPFLFRQDSDMRYLTGCEETDCTLVIHPSTSTSTDSYRSVMFCPAYDPGLEIWDGVKTNQHTASRVWGVDEGLPSAELLDYIQSLVKELHHPVIWYPVSDPPNPTLHTKLNQFLNSSYNIQNPKFLLHEMRLIKSPAEIDLMREACRISGESIKETIRATKAPISEHELFATVDYHCRMKGGNHLAYPPVVAGGARANAIHYISNNQQIQRNEMVLMDAGAEYKGYSGDVTRTWPISGRFSESHRTLYEGVLEVQKQVINECIQRPSLNALFKIMCYKLGPVLQEMKLIPPNLPQDQLARAAFGFCPHHVSHFLGMDIHDTPLVDKTKPLQPGSIITVEPGIYIRENNTTVPASFAGTGIRIEDDLLITETGVEILTSSCPKEVDEIEALVGTA